jgi:hypothetical protein
MIFDITKEQFQDLTQQSCYICGKSPSDNHITGIDRYDSNIGYVLENCRPCCGECNYMKNNYKYEDMIEKFVQIYKHRIISDKYESITYELEFPTNEIVSSDVVYTQNQMSIMVKSNKKSKEEMAENARIRKQEQRKRMKEKMGDEEYRKLRAKEIANNRMNKKTITDK